MENYITQLKNNIMDDANLKDNLSFAAFYIALYENFADSVESRIKEFYWRGCELKEDGEYKEKYSSDYKTKIKDRDVDGKGNHDVLKASMLWLVDAGAIDKDEYEFFLLAKKQRNRFSHELIDVVFRGINEIEIKAFFDLFSLYKKIDKWWINEIEIPTSGEFLPGSYDEDKVSSIITELFEMMIGVLYHGESENLKQLLDQHMKEQ